MIEKRLYDISLDSPIRDGGRPFGSESENQSITENERKKSHKISEFRSHLERYRNLLESNTARPEDDDDEFMFVNQNVVRKIQSSEPPKPNQNR